MNPDKIPYLLGAIFGVRHGAPWPPPPPDSSVALALTEATNSVLVTLSPREEVVIKLRFGLGPDGRSHTLKEVANKFDVSIYRVRQIEAKALRKLRHPARARLFGVFLDETRSWSGGVQPPPVELTPVVETITKLTPGLIAHLKRHEDDLTKIHWRVFEHLVAEFFASRGFKDVSLVGTNAATAADIYAALYIDQIGIEHRYFIEVKRWKHKVGIEVVDRVYGALISERERFGWHAAIIVSAIGFKDMEKWTPYQLRMKGVELKDRDDLLRWLRDYEQKESGLWLPNPPKLTL
jgi:HJR/Mrr/RecB family endonuclease